jgi:hypothetical protein
MRATVDDSTVLEFKDDLKSLSKKYRHLLRDLMIALKVLTKEPENPSRSIRIDKLKKDTKFPIYIAATISAISMIAGTLVLSHRLQEDERLKGYSGFTMITGIMAGIISLLLFSAAFESQVGAIQRISMAIPLIWVEVMAVKLFWLE